LTHDFRENTREIVRHKPHVRAMIAATRSRR
jgi:hypothetical protein